MPTKLKEGDRVKRVCGPDAIPAFRNLRGSVVGFDWTRVLVQWDCDPKSLGPTPYMPEEVELVKEGDDG